MIYIDLETVSMFFWFGITMVISLVISSLAVLKYVTSKRFTRRYFKVIYKITKKESEKICKELMKDD